MTSRVEHVDIAKGISIILVALFHSKLNPLAPDIMNAMGLFRMPLFFFLSGVFFSASADTRTFLWKKSDALLKPYFVTLLTVFVFTVLFAEEDFPRQLIGIFYGNGVTIQSKWIPMWFLTHLFLTYVFTYFIFKVTSIQNKEVFFKYALVVTLMVLGAQWIDVFWYLKFTLFGKEIVIPGLPFGLDIVFISASFFISGTFLREKVINFHPNLCMLALSILTFLLVTIFTDAHMDLNKRVYVTPLFTTAGSVCGIYTAMCLAFYMQKVLILQNIFLVFGQASLFVLIFHVVVGSCVYGYLTGFGIAGFEVYFAAFAFLISIFIPLLIKYFVLKSRALSFFYFPVQVKNVPKG